MAPVLQEVLAANESYAASFGDKGKLAMPPARRFAILTCMDARLDPAKYAGLAEGDAHVIRTHMVDTACVRILASASAHLAAGGKFKGVDA
jgi:carbonic anhydrase